MHHFHLPTTAILTFLLLLFSSAAGTTTTSHRRLLHQPLFPFDEPTTISQPPSSAPSPQPQQPKYPFSTLPPPDSTTPENPFFPSYPSPPPPPPPPPSSSDSSAFATFPANISSLVLPSTSHRSHKPIKLISLIVSVSLLSVLVFASVLLLLLRHRRPISGSRHLKADSLRLFPPDTPTSDTATPVDASKKPPPPLHPLRTPTPTSTSSEFLYLGTLVSSREPPLNPLANDAKAPLPPPSTLTYHRLGSPELHPLPPLPRQHSGQMYANIAPPPAPPPENQDYENLRDIDDDEEFFSPRGSAANNASPHRTRLSSPMANEFNKSRSLNSLNSNSPLYSISPENSPSVVLNSGSPQSMQSKSPDSLVSFPGPLRRFIPPPPARLPRAIPTFSPFSPSSTEDGATTRDCSPRTSDFSGVGRMPPPPPPPPTRRMWDAAAAAGPPELVGPARTVVVQNVGGEKGSLGNSENRGEETLKPKLKPLHWDKVRASSDRAMVWDQLKTSSFQ